MSESIIKSNCKNEYLQGFKNADIAKKYDVPENTLRYWISTENWPDEKLRISNEIKQNFTEKITKGTDAAIDLLISTIKDPKIKKVDRIQAVNSLLSISGLKKETIDNNIQLPKIIIE